MTRNVLKIITIWSSGAFIYGLIEIAFRGFTHISMGVLAGVCLMLISQLNQRLGQEFPMVLKMLLSSIIITTLEFITGILVNVRLHMEVWDYSNAPLNLFGQICLPFAVAWFFLSFFGIRLIDFLKWKIFNEPKPQYSFALKKV